MLNEKSSALLAAVLAFAFLPALAPVKATAAAPEKVGARGLLYRGAKTVEPPVTPSPEEQKRKEVAERLDISKLLYTGKVVVDRDPKMLKPMEHVAGFAGQQYTIARTPPTVEFAVVPVEPLWLPRSPVVPSGKNKKSNEPGPWSNWGGANFDPRTGRFYSSVGDEGTYDAHILLVEYDPATKTVRCLPEVNKVLGRRRDQFAEGKIHGWLDFYKSPDLAAPHLWYCTYWAKYPEPDEEDYASGYDGGHIMSYDVLTGDIVDYGVPLKRASWPYHRVDTKRGMMYAVGLYMEFLAWDIKTQMPKWAGFLPPGMVWNPRAILIDERTGLVYTTDYAEKGDHKPHFIKYDPEKNRFFKLACHVPRNQSTGGRAKNQTYSPMRAQTADVGPDGLFWCASSGGQLFTFDPAKEEIVDKGVVWPGEQTYTCSMERSPGGRYIYYIPGAHGRGYVDGSPVIQYDTRTGTRKVLSFMFPYYYDNYGYTPGGTFSIRLDAKGERLFVLWNGAFVDQNPIKKNADTFGQCSVMLIHIPESERLE